jgi:hypothetical protein
VSEDQVTHVYIMAKCLDDGFESPVKVGIAKHPHGRARDLNTASPFKIAVVQSFACPQRDIALKLEEGFHKVMKPHRLHGEWFDLSPAKAVSCMFENFETFLINHLDFSADEAEEMIALSIAHELPSQ